SCVQDSRPTPALLVVGAGGDFGAAADRNLLVFVLQLIKFVINSTLREQLLVSSFLAHHSLMQDDDLVRPLHRRKPMSDYHRSAAFHHATECITNLKFSFCIHAGSRFVQDENLRVVRQSSSEGNELLLAGR